MYPGPDGFWDFRKKLIFHDFDHFGTVQIGHPENPKIHDFDNLGPFQPGIRKSLKIHHFDHFRVFADFTEFNR